MRGGLPLPQKCSTRPSVDRTPGTRNGAGMEHKTVAALYVAPGGCYYGLRDVEPWGLPERDAREYAGPWPVVAHPPCERWGRYYFGGPQWLKDGRPRKKLGDDGGCFAAALAAVRRWSGVLEHPADSRAWSAHGLTPPKRHAGWTHAGDGVGYTCYVEQGWYGHRGRKATWLYLAGEQYLTTADCPVLEWRKHPSQVALGGLSKERRARRMRTGIVQALSRRQRSATPLPFRDLLLSIARSA